MVLGALLLRSFGRCPFFAGPSALLGRRARYPTPPKCRRVCMTTAISLKEDKHTVSVTFVTQDGQHHNVSGKEGDTLLDVYNNHSLDFPGYANCGGTMACSTCLVVLSEEVYKKSLHDDMLAENDVIDLANSPYLTLRLGCQLRLTKALDGMVVTIPAAVKDLRDDTGS